MKNHLSNLIFGIIELGSYILFQKPIKYIGLKSFFGLWGIISIFLLIFAYLIRNTQFFNRDVMHYQNVNFVRSPEDMAHSTGMKKTIESRNLKLIVVKYDVYIMFLLYFLINVLGFILA